MNRSGIRFNIYFSTPDSDVEQLYVFDPSVIGGGSPSSLALQAKYVNGAVRYFLSLVIDGVNYPAPLVGFETIDELYAWASTNWATLGTWYWLPTLSTVLVYASAESGSLTITPLLGVQALFPPLDEGEFYVVHHNGMTSPGELLYTQEDAVLYAQTNWGGGTWTTDGDYLIFIPDVPGDNTLSIDAEGIGAFSDRFSPGFDI